MQYTCVKALPAIDQKELVVKQEPHRANSDVMPIKLVNSLLRVVVAQGYDVNEVLASVGLAFNPLAEHNVVEEIPTIIYSRLYKHVMGLLQDESFGLVKSQKAPPGTFRMNCLYIIHCQTLEQALKRSAEFYDFCDSFHDTARIPRKPMSFEQDGQIVACRFYNPRQKPDPQNITGDANLLYMMHRFYSWMIGKSIPLMAISFVAPPSAAEQKYQNMFNCPLQFSQNENALKFSSKYLQAPIVQTEDSLHEFLKTAPYQLVRSQDDEKQSHLTAQVREFIGFDFSQDFPSIDKIASKLNISSRTLHRHLQKEGSSYQQIKDDCRRDAAISYLNRPELTISAVSMLMGFKDTSAFYRSFKKWTDLSPGEFRKK